MKKWILLLLAVFICTAGFADRKKKNPAPEQVLSEARQLEFDYSYMEGVRYKITGNFQEALKWFDNCLKILPDSPAVKYEIAGLLSIGNDFNNALKLAREAVSGNPGNMWYKVLLANILQEKSMIEEACQVYAEIIDKYPEKDEFYLLEAGLYASVEKWQKAIDVFDEYEEHYGITEPVSIEKIKLYTKLDDIKKASAELVKLIRKFPDRSEYLSLLAELYFNYNQDKKGLQILDRLLKAEPDNGFVHFYLADYYRGKKIFAEAEKHTRSALLSDKIDNGFKIQYILKLILAPDTVGVTTAQIDSYVGLLLEKYNEDLGVRALYSDLLKRDGKLDEAKKELEYILSHDCNNYLIWEELLLLYNDMQDFGNMYSRSLEAIRYFPERPLPYLMAGVKLTMDGQIKSALPFFKKGVVLSDENQAMKGQFYANLGECYYQLDSVEKAFEMFDETLKINPNDALVLNNYAYYLALRKENLSKAEQMITQAVKMEPDNATSLDTYAWVLYVRENYSQAKFYMKLAIEKSKEISGVLYDHYGDILYRNGEKEEALNMWKKALETGINDKEALNILKQKIETGVLPE